MTSCNVPSIFAASRRWSLAGFLAILLPLVLAACSGDTWFGDSGPPPLPGKRLSVLEHEQRLHPSGDPADIVLPAPEPNGSWPQAGGYSHHAMQHMVIGDVPHQIWSADAGEGSGLRSRLLGQPVVADGRAYVIDSTATVRAFDAETGDRLWETDLAPTYEEDDDSGVMGGGVAFADGRLFATTGFADVVALDAKTGKEIWRTRVTAPMRAGPTVNGGRVFAATLDNTGVALAASDGRILWTHAGVEESAALLGAAEPAVDNGVVVMPYTSGEVAALRVDTGAPLWMDSVVATQRTDAAANLTDITARPVIDQNRVFVIGHSGLLAGIDMRTGDRAWSVEAGGTTQPWVAGRYLYVVTTDNQLVAIENRTGRVVWTLQLVQWADPEDGTGPISWTGPTLASDRLILTGSNGVLLSVSPYDGSVLGQMEISSGISLEPAVANGTLYFLTDDATLLAFR